MTQNAIIKISKLGGRVATSFELKPDAVALAEISTSLELSALRKLVFSGEISPQGSSDWELKGHLGATVVQPCVVTLEPVTTRIEEDVIRIYLANWSTPQETETEMTEDDSVEPLRDIIDLTALAAEVLALAIPQFPRAANAQLGEFNITEPGAVPLSDESAKPFAGLAALKDKLGKTD